MIKKIQSEKGNYVIDSDTQKVYLLEDFKYTVNSNRVLTKKAGEINTSLGGNGYVMVWIFKQKKYIHRIMLETFQPVDGMENLQVNHIDGNKQNNSLRNLEWVTGKENMKHASLNNLINHDSEKRKASAKTNQKKSLLKNRKPFAYYDAVTGDLVSVYHETENNLDIWKISSKASGRLRYHGMMYRRLEGLVERFGTIPNKIETLPKIVKRILLVNEHGDVVKEYNWSNIPCKKDKVILQYNISYKNEKGEYWVLK